MTVRAANVGMDLGTLREELRIPGGETCGGGEEAPPRPEGLTGEARVTHVGDLLWVHAERTFSYTTCDETTDRLSGDPAEDELHWDWVGPASSAPSAPRTGELDGWALHRSTYERHNLDSGWWGNHQGVRVLGVKPDGAVEVLFCSGEYHDVSPEQVGRRDVVRVDVGRRVLALANGISSESGDTGRTAERPEASTVHCMAD